MSCPKIKDIKAREILDSKGIPTLEVDVLTSDGHLGRGAAPTGISVGSHEAVVLRDGEPRFQGLGVQRALRNVVDVILPALRNRNVCQQHAIDSILIELDGTPDKSRLGANAIYSVSIAVARAAANSLGVPLYRYLNDSEKYTLPVPVFNMINGGRYGDREVDFQEFLLLPTGASSYPEALRMGVEIFYQVDKVIVRRYGGSSLEIGRSAGWAAPINKPAEILEILLESAEAAGYADGIKVGLDCAASHFYDQARARYRFKGGYVKRQELIDFLMSLANSSPLCLIADPINEDAFEGPAMLTTQLDHVLIAGDDLFVTNLDRLRKGVELGAANAIVLKPNMVGTISEALEVASYARAQGYQIIPAGRAGGTVDDPIPDIAVAIGAQLAKFGAPRAGEKVNKYNRLLQIHDELVDSASFPDINRLLTKRGGRRCQKKHLVGDN